MVTAPVAPVGTTEAGAATSVHTATTVDPRDATTTEVVVDAPPVTLVMSVVGIGRIVSGVVVTAVTIGVMTVVMSVVGVRGRASVVMSVAGAGRIVSDLKSVV